MLPESNSEELAQVEQSEETQGVEEQSQDENSSKFDPSKLTPELQKVYKSMQADYTRKTQSLSEEKKAILEEKGTTEKMRGEYEQRLRELTQPKQKDEIDVANMTSEQRSAWDTLNKHFDQKLEKVRSEERAKFEGQLLRVQSQLGDIAWKTFEKENPTASKYRGKMREIYQEKGGVNCPLTLDELLTLSMKDDLKKLGAEEYRKTVELKKKAVTTKPTSTAGEETELDYHKGPRLTMAQKAENIKKAFFKGKEIVERNVERG